MTEPTAMTDFIREWLRDEEFQRAVLSGAVTGGVSPWRRVVVRRVALRSEVATQVNWHTEKNVVTRNYPTVDAAVADLVEVPFRNVHVELRSATIECRSTKRGKLLTSRKSGTNTLSLAHDRVPDRPITPDAPFLEVLGVSQNGVVKPTAQRKYRQINEFVKILGSTLGGHPPAAAVQVLDLGCGNAYLTFATVHHLLELGRACAVTGVDRDTGLVSRNNGRARQLGWADQLRFEPATIERYAPTDDPDLVIALHACDTATDDALALGVDHGASYLLASPCCHHDLQRQLGAATIPEGFRDVARDGVLKEQLGDVLTDGLRASVLRMVGYRVDVFAFVPVEHTPRNNLIRAVRTAGPAQAEVEASVRALTGMFNVRPRLAELLRHRLPPDLLSAVSTPDT